MQEITIERTQHPKQKPTDQTRLGFGNYYTDHMFLMNYDEGKLARSAHRSLWSNRA